jgi:hypothetical protein
VWCVCCCVYIGIPGGGITLVRYGMGRKQVPNPLCKNKCGVVIVLRVAQVVRVGGLPLSGTVIYIHWSKWSLTNYFFVTAV